MRALKENATSLGGSRSQVKASPTWRDLLLWHLTDPWGKARGGITSTEKEVNVVI